jgi:2-polyprenyl-6-hydroxyphenyl methylase/3-demethylubiquinone-9 3-methyltransferase
VNVGAKLNGGNRMDRVKVAAGTAVDAIELARFNDATADWWDLDGAARWLHRYNPLRVAYIRDAACDEFDRDAHKSDCLRGLRILDIGCGGGVLCEPLARLGATVIGADPARNCIEVAKAHAQETGVQVDYRCQTAEALAMAGERFDVVLAMEVIEHVADSGAFLQLCAGLLKPRGLVIVSTISRTFKSFAFAIAIGEYLLRLLPPGTHRWDRFRRPDEIGASLAPHGLAVSDVTGVTWSFSARGLRLSANTDVTYMLTARRDHPMDGERDGVIRHSVTSPL